VDSSRSSLYFLSPPSEKILQVWIEKKITKRHGKTCLWEPGEVERKHKTEGLNENYGWERKRDAQ